MSDPGQPFTEEELYLAFRLTRPEDEARTLASQATHPGTGAERDGLDPDGRPTARLLPHTLLLLSLVSGELHRRVVALRDRDADGQDRRWLARELRRVGLPADAAPPEWLVQKCEQVRERQTGEWEARREQLRRALAAEGRLPPA